MSDFGPYKSEEERKQAFAVDHPISKKSKTGVESNVPCPWCGKRNNHKMLAEYGGRDPIPESKLTENSLYIDCDFCGNLMYVSAIAREPVISVKQFHKVPKPPYEPIPTPKEEEEEK